MTIRKDVQISVTSKGTVTVKKELNDIGQAAKKTSGDINLMRSALAGLTSYLTVSAFVQYSDAATKVGNALRLAGLQGQEFVKTQNAVYQTAIQNGQSSEQLSAIYLKLAASSKNLGMNNQDMIATLSGVASAMRLSTAGTNAQAGALQQLSQLLGGTKVQAQEYNSLIDGAYPLLQAVAAGSRRWAGDVSKLTQDVKNSSVSVKEFVDALREGLPMIEEQAKNIPLTVAQSFSALHQAVQAWIATSSEASVIGRMLSNAILMIVDNINTVLPALIGLGATMTTVFGVKLIASAVANVVLLTSSLIRLTTVLTVQIIPAVIGFAAQIGIMTARAIAALPALVTMGTALTATNLGFVAVVASATALVLIIANIADLLFNGGRAFEAYKDAALGAVTEIKSYFASILDFMGGGQANINVIAQQAASQLQSASTAGAAQFGNQVKNAANQGGKQMATIIVDSAKQVADPIKSGIQNGVKDAVKDISITTKDAGKSIADAIKEAGNSVGTLWRNMLDQAAASMVAIWTNGLSQWSQSFVSQFKTAGNEWVSAFKSAASAAANAMRQAMSVGNAGGAEAPGFARGGAFRVGGAGGTDSQMVKFRATPNERVTVETPDQQRATDRALAAGNAALNGEFSAGTAPAPVVRNEGPKIINVIDPRMVIDAIATDEGARAIINVIGSNRADVARRLGIR